MEVMHGEIALVGSVWVVAMRHIQDVGSHVLLDYEPGATAEAQSLALSDGIKPQTAVLTYLLARLQFYHLAGIVAQISADIIIVIDFTQEADALRILSVCIHQMFAFSYLPPLILHVVADGEERLLQLPVVYLRQEVCLVLHGVRTGSEPFPSVYPFRLRIVSRSDEVIVMTLLLIEGTKLDEPVAHHVRVGRKSRLHLIHGVAGPLVPIFPVAVHHLQPAAVFMRHGRSHLQGLLAAAVPLLFFLWSYLDVETVGMKPQLGEFIYHHTAVHAAREQHSYPLILYFFWIHGAKLQKNRQTYYFSSVIFTATISLRPRSSS